MSASQRHAISQRLRFSVKPSHWPKETYVLRITVIRLCAAMLSLVDLALRDQQVTCDSAQGYTWTQ